MYNTKREREKRIFIRFCRSVRSYLLIGEILTTRLGLIYDYFDECNNAKLSSIVDFIC